MIELTVQKQAHVITCHHFLQADHFFVRQFSFKLGNSHRVHLCAQCAEYLAKGLLEQLEKDQNVEHASEPIE